MLPRNDTSPSASIRTEWASTEAYVDGRAARCQQRRRGIHRLTVEAIDYLAALALHHHLFETVLHHRDTHLAQIDRTAVDKSHLAALVGHIPHQHYRNEEAASRKSDLKCAVTHRCRATVRFSASVTTIGILNGRTRGGIRHAAAHGTLSLRRGHNGLRKKRKTKEGYASFRTKNRATAPRPRHYGVKIPKMADIYRPPSGNKEPPPGIKPQKIWAAHLSTAAQRPQQRLPFVGYAKALHGLLYRLCYAPRGQVAAAQHPRWPCPTA